MWLLEEENASVSGFHRYESGNDVVPQERSGMNGILSHANENARQYPTRAE